MKIIGKELGPEFRKIRKAKRITLIEISKGISSEPSLSKWERGLQNIPANVYCELLRRLHIMPSEIEVNKSQIKPFMIKVSELYINNKNIELRNLGIELLNKYSKTHTFMNLLKAATVCNFYLDSTGEDITDELFKIQIRLQLFDPEGWHHEQVVLFTNTQLLLDSKSVYKLARLLASHVYETARISDDDSFALINSVLTLIKRKKVSAAKKMLHILKNIKLVSYNYVVQYRMEFYDVLLKYVETLNPEPIKKYFSSLSNSKVEQQVLEDSKSAYLQIRKIYEE